MRKTLSVHTFAITSLVAVGALTVCAPPSAMAANFLDNLKSQAQQQMGSGDQAAATNAGNGGGAATSGMAGALGGLGLPAMSSSTGTNAAGVLTYCAKNNYLNASNAQNIKDKLLSKAGLRTGTAQQDNDYREGAAGLLQGSNGTTLNLDNVKSNLKRKACDYVLSHAKSFI